MLGRRWIVLLSLTGLVLLAYILWFYGKLIKSTGDRSKIYLSFAKGKNKNLDGNEMSNIKRKLLTSVSKNSKIHLKGTVPKDLEFDISKTRDYGNNGYIKIISDTYIQVPGFKGFTHVLKNKSKVSKYLFQDLEQQGLPTDQQFDAFLIFFKEANLDQLPFIVCPITSIDNMTYECYLRDPNDHWFKNDSLSEIEITDPKFGEKASEIVYNHYGLDGSSNFDMEPTNEDEEDLIDIEDTLSISSVPEDSETSQNFEFDISKTDGNEGQTRIIDGTYIQVPGFKGFTHVLKNKSKVSKYLFQDLEQQGLPTDQQFDAFLIFFKEANLDQLPFIVCPITSIDNMTYECYLRDPNDHWFKNDSLSEIEITDTKFGEKASKIVRQHYEI
uniref:Uncharacterized protein n=1 Tax=Theileria annulata TaxID=5874 RepID=A0A3B0N9Y1_THEAN